MAPENVMASALATTIGQAASGQQTPKARTIFVFSGEGVHSADTDASLLRASSEWPAVLQAIQKLGHEDAEAFLLESLGQHAAPRSTVATVAVNILNAALWRQWGQKPDLVLGHSVGEVAAACVAGLLSTEEAVHTAHALGVAMAQTKGAMLHVELPRKELASFPAEDGLSVAAINYIVRRGDIASGDLLSVTLCGPAESVSAFLAREPGAVKLRPEHPWHHPNVSVKLDLPASGQEARCVFVSACSGTQLGELHEVGPAHWEAWLRTPVRFDEALAAAATEPSSVIEMGAHPVMAAAVRAAFGSHLITYACTMRRGEPGVAHVRSQRATLPGFAAGLEAALRSFSISLPRRGVVVVDYDADFADQGIASQQLVLLASALAPYFPGLAAHDLYRFTSLRALVQTWEGAATCEATKFAAAGAALEVVGCAARLPAGINSPGDFMGLLERDDQSAAFSAAPKGAPPAAYLCPRFGRDAALAAAERVGLDGAEALALDPQHALALALAEQMWQDAGERAAAAARARPERVGVYIGAWQPAAASAGQASAYRTIGSSLSALASRVANAYNLQGPCHTVNTACSSALVAVDAALHDAKAGGWAA